MTMQLKASGIEELSKSLRALGGVEAKRARRNASRFAGKTMAAHIKDRAPVRTTGGEIKRTGFSTMPGNLRDSVKVGRDFNGVHVTIVPVLVEYYGVILNIGKDERRGLRFKARGWADSVVQTKAQSIVNEFSDEMWKFIAKQWQKFMKNPRKI